MFVYVYKIHWVDDDSIYVGSTFNPSHRFAGHRYNMLIVNTKLYIYARGKSTAPIFTILEKATVTCKIEKRMVEQWWIDKLKPCLNSKRALCIPYQKIRQYKYTGLAGSVEYAKSYYQKNKIKIAENSRRAFLKIDNKKRIPCMCGGSYTYYGKSQHLRTRCHKAAENLQ